MKKDEFVLIVWRPYLMKLVVTTVLQDYFLIDYFQSSFRLRVKLSRKYMEFPSTQPLPQCPASVCYICCNHWTFTDPSISLKVHSLHQGSLLVLRILGVLKNVHHCNVIQDSFIALQFPCALTTLPSFPLNHWQPLIFCCLQFHLF